MNESRLRLTLAVDYLGSNMGRFSLMPVLAILLADQGGGAGAARTGVGMFGFMLCAGLSSLLAIRWLPRIPYIVSLPLSMVCSAAGFGLLPYAGTLGSVGLLFLAGFGISVHAVLSRVLIAEHIHSETGRNNVYSMQQIATNIAASLGPFIAAGLYVSGNGRPLLALVAVAYLVAGVALAAGLPRGLRPSDVVRERGRGTMAALALFGDPQTRQVTAVTAVGTFVYAQFYSAFALLVALGIQATVLKGALLAGPPVAIVILQAAVTAVVNRRLRAGVTPIAVLTAANVVFGVAMLLLGAGLPLVIGATAAMTIFAVAEMMFTPMVSTAFNRISAASQLAASNLQQLAWTAGEALGSLAGGGLFLLAYHHRLGNLYWLSLGAVAVVVPYLMFRRTAGTPEPARAEPSSERTVA